MTEEIQQWHGAPSTDARGDARRLKPAAQLVPIWREPITGTLPTIAAISYRARDCVSWRASSDVADHFGIAGITSSRSLGWRGEANDRGCTTSGDRHGENQADDRMLADAGAVTSNRGLAGLIGVAPQGTRRRPCDEIDVPQMLSSRGASRRVGETAKMGSRDQVNDCWIWETSRGGRIRWFLERTGTWTLAASFGEERQIIWSAMNPGPWHFYSSYGANRDGG
ncbi:hypothetical protein C8R44DRAFT_739007 [Mycena epipterygia]|nr:hypothetical protein C8R44DRAFT_739007 [Mycena epipterygia]